jgi:aspartyl-tRNA(Asn)/glutamyl-tRNA(Gln) amidotransferase subunit A
LGKTNLTEFCYGATGENPAFGDINNPWNLDRVPGGSSSGAAAAAATDVCRVAIGSDTGGSVRIPAALCGVVGLRPTFGRVSNANALGLTVDFDTIGPIARSVSDVARAFAVIAGYDPNDPASVDLPAENFLPTLRNGIAGVRVGLPRRYFFENLQPEIEQAVLAAARTLERAGARLIDMAVPNAEQAQTNIHICLARADMADIHRDEMDRRPDAIGPEVLRRLRLGLDVSGRDYAAARRWLARWRLDLREMFTQVDLLLTPTTPIVAPLRKSSADMVETTQALARFTVGIGCAGLPAITLPCGFGEAGMPIGAQLVAKWWDEALLFRAGCAFQQLTDFHLARPPLVAQG